MKKVFVLRGISGCGKSTYARKLRQEYEDASEFCEVRIVSADTYFDEKARKLGCTYAEAFDPAELSAAHATCFRHFLNALLSVADVIIVDNTNTTAMEISPYMLAAAAHDYEAEIINLTESVVVAHHRNVHHTPFEAVNAQAKRIRDEWLPPWWAQKEAV